MAVTHLRVSDELADAARTRSGLPASATLPALARFALARLAGWPEPAARQAARVRAGYTRRSR